MSQVSNQVKRCAIGETGREEKKMERIKSILEKYSPEGGKEFRNTVDMLCKKGIANGCYQDYTVLMDVLEILSICETIIEGGKHHEL